jgi:hypothetical protein
LAAVSVSGDSEAGGADWPLFSLLRLSRIFWSVVLIPGFFDFFSSISF